MQHDIIEQPQRPHLTVKALTQYIARKYDADPYLQKVWVVGEVSNFSNRANTHQYFKLKDEHAIIDIVMYKSSFVKLPFILDNGMKVIVRGRVSVYDKRGTYQIIVDHMEPDGIGALYLAFEQLKKRFKDQGLLDLPKKRIPIFPQKIAVITSPSGAVIRDILTTIKRRYPIVQVTVFPTRVQGNEAIGEIVSAFEQVEALKSNFDTVILARGGGSIEDLWCFNEERVANAIIACSLPVITAIGHETDTTLSDLVSDMRAPTPTAAAEISVPVLVELKEYLQQQAMQLYRLMTQHITALKKQHATLEASYVFQQPDRLYQAYMQQLDQLVERLYRSETQSLDQKQAALHYATQRLFIQDPTRLIDQYRQMTTQYHDRLDMAFQRLLEQQQHLISNKIALLDAYSPLKIMARGYSIATKQTVPIKSIHDIALDDTIQVQVLDGTLSTTVIDIKPVKSKDV